MSNDIHIADAERVTADAERYAHTLHQIWTEGRGALVDVHEDAAIFFDETEYTPAEYVGVLAEWERREGFTSEVIEARFQTWLNDDPDDGVAERDELDRMAQLAQLWLDTARRHLVDLESFTD